MLRELDIENLAVIEKAAISFCDKFNVFSGETGAGKSILIGGINAVLGGRIGRDIVRSGENKAAVTALFDEIPENVRRKLEENGYSCGEELLLQREITSDGKTTARINGKVATVAVLREIALGLIDIHGQHDTAILMSTDNQRSILDAYAGLEAELSDYKETFHEFSKISRTVKTIQLQAAEKEKRINELSEKIEDVSRYDLKIGDENEITERLETARNYEEIQRALSSAYGSMIGYDDDVNAVGLIRDAVRELNRISDKLKEIEPLNERLSGLLIDLEDIGSEISGLLTDGYSTESLSELETRKSDILALKRRYGMDIDPLLLELENWKKELDELKNSDDILEQLSEKRRQLADTVKEKAQMISDKRKKAASDLEKAVTEELIFLDMPNVKLIFDFHRDKITADGMDQVEMLISVNKGEDPRPMNRIASGGELSRIMLAIKNVLASADNIPTMIFDEIDTGISGRAAQKVGIKLSEIAQKRQVLCVTHLAQIAAMGDKHFLIEKTSDKNRTYTSVRSLDFEERKHEIARIISGDSDSEVTLLSAEELLNRRDASANKS